MRYEWMGMWERGGVQGEEAQLTGARLRDDDDDLVLLHRLQKLLPARGERVKGSGVAWEAHKSQERPSYRVH